jgi:arabinogalactan oligomer/maltooligosaccharide transport system substrate-binding protein
MEGKSAPADAVKEACAAMNKASGKTAAAPAAPAAAAPAPTGLKGAVTLWHAYGTGSTEEKALTQVLAEMKKDSPDLKVNVLQIPFDQVFNKWETEVAAGGGPDMFVAPNDDLFNWVQAKVVLDITDKLAGKLDKVSQSGVDGMKVGGKLYGVPESAKAVGLYYNKSLLATPPKTMDELLKSVKDGNKLTLFLGAYHMFGLTGAFGGKLFDASGKCIADQGGWAEAMQLVVDLKAAGATVESDYGKAETPFRTGKAAMFINGPWALGDYKKDLGDKLGVVPIPAGPKGKANPLNGIDGFYINPNSKNVQGAIDLALFLTSKESSEVYTAKAGHVPIRSDVVSADPLLTAFAQASAEGYPRPQSAEFANFWGPFGDAWTKVIEGAQKPAEGVKAACDAMNQANKK